MFKREERKNKFIGYSLSAGSAFFFFGSRHLPKTELEIYFPEYRFAFLKQIHGKVLAEADPEKLNEADAHYTAQKNLALVSQTADCIPILLANDDAVCAIHSGWKGSALNIVSQASAAFGDLKPKYAAIGPHILMPSFEVGRDIATQLLAAAPAGTKESQLVYPHDDPQKAYFDLAELARLQLYETFGEKIFILECLEDTKTSAQFHSFRRDRSEAGRQFSFVVLKA